MVIEYRKQALFSVKLILRNVEASGISFAFLTYHIFTNIMFNNTIYMVNKSNLLYKYNSRQK